MIALLQRVTSAAIHISGEKVAQIDTGLVVLVGFRPLDSQESASRLLTRVLKYRVFRDDAGKMNLNLQQIGGGLLLVPQFTLAADTRHGLRPGFTTAAAPDLGRRLFEGLRADARAQHPRVEYGVFGADMQVSLVNDGPVTFWLEA